MTNPVSHQGFQGLPRLDTPITNPDRTISLPWYRVFVSLFQRTGMTAVGEAQAAGATSVQNAVVFVQSQLGAGLPLKVYSVSTGELLGTVTVTPP